METRDVKLEDVPADACCYDCGTLLTERAGFATYNEGKQYKCDRCFALDPILRPKCEVYSRVCGYLRPVENWNAGKQAEFEDRKEFGSL